ncbi:MAG TPA: ABC transporter permease [Pyrinomonadaceae bacterium]|nr:ABC transporter permease [Pyrinomonadaceae bacterium]
MKNPFHTPFAAVFTNEVLLNAKRVTPYVLMVLFAANAVLWWGWGPAVQRGWATNSDFYIRRHMGGFSFILGLPIFTAIMMGDIVVRDFRLGVDPLIFSKPVGRASYLLGKFLGSFFVLVCCQSVYAITLVLLQWVPFTGMVFLPVKVVPYFKHFFIVVVISHLALAAIYFAAGTLTRNAKVVYGLAACFYPVYIALQLLVFLKLPKIFNVLFDPLGFNLGQGGLLTNPWNLSADFLNKAVASYNFDQYANRVSNIIVTGLLLLLVYFRFRIDSQEKKAEPFTKLTLSDAPDRMAYSAPSYGSIDLPVEAVPVRDRITLPKVSSTKGPAATLSQIISALGVEFRLLRAERGLIVLVPLAILLSFLSVPFSRIATEVSYSVTSATNTANMLLLFLAGAIVFYTGEAMNRDRELKIEPVIWSTPAPNSVLLLSKWLAMTLLSLLLVLVGGLTTIVTQVIRGYTPVDVSAYLIINGVVVVPGVVFLTSFVVALNVLLRNNYVVYVVAIGAGVGLVYLYNLGYKHWSYNPLLYQLWTYSNLTDATMLAHRLYCLALAAACLALAHVLFERGHASRVFFAAKRHKKLKKISKTS